MMNQNYKIINEMSETELIENIDNFIKYHGRYEINLTNKKRKKILQEISDMYDADIAHVEYVLESVNERIKAKELFDRINMDKLLINEIKEYMRLLPKEKIILPFRGVRK